MSLLSLPFRILVLDSALHRAALIERFGGDLDPGASYLWRPPGTRAWVGFVKAEGLEILRRTPFRNSFQPVVRARFEPLEQGTRLRVSMSLRLITRLLLGLWTLVATVACVGLYQTAEPLLVVIPIMMVMTYLMCAVSFNVEANLAEAYLRQRIA